jgi:hypothetical protein
VRRHTLEDIMIESLPGYTSPSMITDTAVRDSLNAFITETSAGLSTPGSDVAELFASPDVAISGSGLDEYFMGPDAAQSGISLVTTSKVRWEPRVVVSWMRDQIAWAQIRIDAHTVENGTPVVVPYVTIGIFERNGDEWGWLYWGGGEPQQQPRL